MSEPDVIIYTDGACSKNPGPGGWGVLLISRGTARYLSGYEPHTTNNRMELRAAIVGLKTLTITKRVVAVLYTDSLYVRDGISKWVHAWAKNNWRKYNNKPVENQGLWQELIEQNEKHNVNWQWVRGHASDEFNNFVDLLATRAIINKSGVDQRLPLSELKERLAAGDLEQLTSGRAFAESANEMQRMARKSPPPAKRGEGRKR